MAFILWEHPCFITSGICSLKSTGVLKGVRANINTMIGSSPSIRQPCLVALQVTRQNRYEWEGLPYSELPRNTLRRFWRDWRLHFADSGEANKIWIIIHLNSPVKEDNVMNGMIQTEGYRIRVLGVNASLLYKLCSYEQVIEAHWVSFVSYIKWGCFEYIICIMYLKLCLAIKSLNKP